jgi:hypothetical protein
LIKPLETAAFRLQEREHELVTAEERTGASDPKGAAGSPFEPAAPVCDVCEAPLVRDERRRLVWDSGVDGELVLAELCSRCAGESDRLLQLYGGRWS